jgi:DNA-binding transcriptional MocR family regulator
LLEVPQLLDPSQRENVSKLFPADAIHRATVLRDAIGSVGAYSHSQGVLHIRKNVAKFIEERDGVPSNPDNIFLTAGASEGVKACLNILIGDSNVGVRRKRKKLIHFLLSFYPFSISDFSLFANCRL